MPKRSHTDNLYLVSFGLPATFPPEAMPEAARQFVRDAEKGMPAVDMLLLATQRGFSPLWKPLPHMLAKDVYGLGLDVDGMQVPLMAQMMRVSPTHDRQAPVEERQMTLLH